MQEVHPYERREYFSPAAWLVAIILIVALFGFILLVAISP